MRVLLISALMLSACVATTAPPEIEPRERVHVTPPPVVVEPPVIDPVVTPRKPKCYKGKGKNPHGKPVCD